MFRTNENTCLLPGQLFPVLEITKANFHDFIAAEKLIKAIALELIVYLSNAVMQKKGTFYVSTLIIPKQEATSDSVSDNIS
jgi:hypothetical protein